jgi:hypothetical protein
MRWVFVDVDRGEAHHQAVRDPRDRAVICYAGLTAEQIAGVEAEYSVARSQLDLEDAAAAVAAFATRQRLDAEQLATLAARLRTHTRTQLEAHWRSLETIAAALEQTPMLDEAEILELVGAPEQASTKRSRRA